MNKFSCLKMLENNGDSVITIQGEPDIVATKDFDNKYIKRERRGKFSIEKNAVLVFSWTDYKFRNINVSDIKSIKPLSDILRNVDNG